MKVGYFLSSEELGPKRIVEHARDAEAAGFEDLWISDHIHPWNDEQGHSPFVWAAIGAIAASTRAMHVTTAVTCPTVRLHPAIVAHAAATSAVLLDGRFTLGVGSGEALNEHIFGDSWPEAAVRLEMLEEAIELIRSLWKGGQQSHRGNHYRVENLRIYDLPARAPKVFVSGFGPKSIELAARVGDGYCLVTPDSGMVSQFREQAADGATVAGSIKVCFHQDEAAARQVAHRLWPNDALPGELAQILPTPAHFEQAAGLVTEDMVADIIPCGPDPERHLAGLQQYVDAGFDELYVQQVGRHDDPGFFEFYSQQILPRFR